LAGANLIYGAGMIESGVTFDCSQFVMDNEIAKMIKHVVGGIRVDDESLAVEDIAGVGPFGDFLSLDATLKHMRELFLPEFMDRRPFNEWEEKKDDARDWALAKARRRLETHQPDPLDESISKEMAKIIDSLEK